MENSAGNGTDERLLKMAEFLYRKVSSAFVIGKKNVHFLSTTLQVGQIRLIKRMLLCITKNEILTNKSKGGISPLTCIGTESHCGK
jgi:hypothetical protein